MVLCNYHHSKSLRLIHKTPPVLVKQHDSAGNTARGSGIACTPGFPVTLPHTRTTKPTPTFVLPSLHSNCLTEVKSKLSLNTRLFSYVYLNLSAILSFVPLPLYHFPHFPPSTFPCRIIFLYLYVLRFLRPQLYKL